MEWLQLFDGEVVDKKTPLEIQCRLKSKSSHGAALEDVEQ